MSTLNNSVRLEGRITKEISLKETENNKKVVNFDLAVDDSYKKENGEKVSKANFIKCVVWGNSAEYLSKYATTKSIIQLEGKLTTRSYEDGDKNTRYITEVLVNDLKVNNYNQPKEQAEEA